MYHALAVKYELVLTAYGIGVGDDDVILFRPLGKHFQAFFPLAFMVGRRVDIHDHFGACQCLDARGPFFIPDVLADVHAHADAFDGKDGIASSRAEVPVFIEHPIVRQEYLAIGVDMLSVGQYCGGIEEAVVVAVNESDDRDDPPCRLLDIFERLDIVLHEPGLQDQVLGRIAGHGKLGQRDNVGTELFRALDRDDDLVAVARKVADNGVDLGHGNADRSHRVLVKKSMHKSVSRRGAESQS